jgi:hypothetical protein
MADDAKDPAGLAAKCPGHSFPTGGWAMAANPANCQCCLAEALGRVMAERDRLAMEVTGERKANAILSAGLESTCERYDELKHECRRLREALQPFATMAEVVCREDVPLFATDMMEGDSGEKVAWTRHVHRAAELLAPGGKAGA